MKTRHRHPCICCVHRCVCSCAVRFVVFSLYLTTIRELSLNYQRLFPALLQPVNCSILSFRADPCLVKIVMGNMPSAPVAPPLTEKNLEDQSGKVYKARLLPARCLRNPNKAMSGLSHLRRNIRHRSRARKDSLRSQCESMAQCTLGSESQPDNSRPP